MTVTTEPLSHIESRETIDFVDATPDGGYALRILEAYRKRCDCLWLVAGLSEERMAVYARMNCDQAKRAEELDAAIAVLRDAMRKWCRESNA